MSGLFRPRNMLCVLLPALPFAYFQKTEAPPPTVAELQDFEDSVRSTEERRQALHAEYQAMLALNRDGCLAVDKRTQACLAESGQYNRYVSTAEAPMHWDTLSPGAKRDEIHRRKTGIIRGMASEKHVEALARSPGFHAFAGKAIDSSLASRRAQAKSRYPLDTLQKLYKNLYTEYFKGGARKQFSILASSDSAYIDSIHDARRSGRPAGKGSARGPEPEGLWRPCAETCLSDFRGPVLDSLKPGESTRPLRVAFGSALLRLDSIEVRPPIPFQDALLYLPAFAEGLRMRSEPTMSQAKAYYSDHIEEFEIPDTLILDVWLMPSKARAGKTRPTGGAALNARHADTLNFRPLRRTQFDLPKGVRDFVHSRGKVGGYLVAEFDHGLWAFRILEMRETRGARTRKFETVKDEILRALDSASRKEAEDIAFSSAAIKNASITHMLLEKMYAQYLARTDTRLSGIKLRPLPTGAEAGKTSPADSAAFEEHFQFQEKLRTIRDEERERWLDETVEFKM